MCLLIGIIYHCKINHISTPYYIITTGLNIHLIEGLKILSVSIQYTIYLIQLCPYENNFRVLKLYTYLF